MWKSADLSRTGAWFRAMGVLHDLRAQRREKANDTPISMKCSKYA
eukprot:CAMPEP_0169335134 /NCGR_PEP_ID=MMETSP1017-20121227/16163_1 /TAXON_ID=342587 /ORGANISM="Karlodinium micrum, Strain CCMP2283" /LENGTH=44 /DNA_ID= /DNA_START= /DNA_END= /DNA_ORIENTATION=